MAGGMERCGAGHGRLDPIEADLVDQELRELMDPRRDTMAGRKEVGAVGEEVLVVVDDHRCARTGRHHDRAVRRIEDADGVLGHRVCLTTMPRVERRLPAAGLVLRELDREAPPFEHADDGPTDVRVEHVHNARDEELNGSAAHGVAHVRSSWGSAGRGVLHEDPPR